MWDWCLSVGIADEAQLEAASQHLSALDGSNASDFFDALRDIGVIEPSQVDFLRRSAPGGASHIPAPAAGDGEDAVDIDWAAEENFATAEVRAVAPPAEERAHDAAPDADALEGSALGPCRIETLIARGVAGAIYRAFHEKLGRLVAVKVLAPSVRGVRIDVERVLADARALASVRHPNVVRVHEVGEDRGLHYLVMDLLESPSVADRLRKSGRLEWREACRVGHQAALGLAAAHAVGVVHRGVKPDSLLMTSDFDVRVGGFGLGSAEQAAASSGAPGIVGAPAYLAPEQIDSCRADARSDVYALGCTLYEMLTGRPPFEGETPADVLLAHVHRAPVPAHQRGADVPAFVARVVERCLAKRPEERFPDATALAEDLRLLAEGGRPDEGAPAPAATLPRPRATAYRVPPSVPPTRPLVTAAGGLVVVAVAALGLTMALPRLAAPALLAAPAPAAADGPAAPADAELAQLLEHAAARPTAIDELLARLDALEERRGESFAAAASVARTRLVAAFEQAREHALDASLERAAAAFAADDAVAATTALLDLPERLRTGPRAGEWTAELTSALARVTETTGMAYVPGGAALLGPERSPREMAAFLVDLAEVSNSEYARFVRETGARAPAHWGGAEPPAELRDLPVVGVTHAEADAFAHWAGKRLPTAAEWERAARGPEGLLYPWGERFDAQRCAVRGSAEHGLQPVRSLGEGRALCGAYHLAGNAAEWTATAGTDAGTQVVRGGSVRSDPSNATTVAGYALPADASDPELYVGFRCVRDVR